MLDVINLRKVYPTGDEALSGVSFEVTDNSLVSIIGPSGAGKSTLIRCINRLTEPTAGEIWLADTEVTALSEKQLRHTRRSIGMVFQEYALVERLTVMENVLSGRLGYTSTWQSFRRQFAGDDVERAYELLEQVGLEGYEDKRADELSGGQRQRVGIARAVMQEPKVLLADEPTSSLDPETSNTVMDILTDVAAHTDIPVIMNIHEVPLATAYSDRIIGLHDGSIVFDGRPNEIDEQVSDRIYRGIEHPEEPDDEQSAEAVTETPAKPAAIEMD